MLPVYEGGSVTGPDHNIRNKVYQMKKRSSFSGKLGFVLSAAGASVGLGNIWRFPYLLAKYGGGIFLLIYILLALTFGYTMIMAETSLGRMTHRSPVGAFKTIGKHPLIRTGGWLNAIIPILIVPYYSVIGGWVLKYLVDYIFRGAASPAEDDYFTTFITGIQPEIWFVVFCLATLAIIFMGVKGGIERVSKILMPILVVLALVISIYSATRPGALAGIRYMFVPELKNFSWMTVVAAMGQMFYSLSIAMGILITFGSYMKKDVSIEESTDQVEVFDTAIAILAGLMIIPAVFAFSGPDAGENLGKGPSLMFITMPEIFHSMGFGRVIGIAFFALVLFAALTSSIALTESAVSTFEDELHWSRRKGTALMAVIMIALGSLSALGYGILSHVKIIGMQFLDFFDFLTNSVMMPLAAVSTCILINRVIGLDKIEEEITRDGHKFRRRPIFRFMIRYLCPLFCLIILVSSVLDAFGFIKL